MPLHSFLGIFLVLLSLFLGCSREDKEEHAGSDDSLPPESFRVVSVEPEDAAEQVSIQTSLKVVFNSEIDQETVYPGSILLVQNSTFIQGNHEVYGKSLNFQPKDNLSHSTTYQWSVVSGIRNLNGQMLETTIRMTFKTEDYEDRIPPRLLLVTPQDNASGVATDSSIQMTFSEPILSESLNAENFSLLDANGKVSPVCSIPAVLMRFLPHLQPWIISGNTASKSEPGSQNSAVMSSMVPAKHRLRPLETLSSVLLTLRA